MMKFYTLTQNNVSGYLYQNNNVDQFIIVEAVSSSHAIAILPDIIDDYRDYCSCCGPRWYDDYLNDKDGEEEPMIYGEPIKSFNDSFWTKGSKAIVYYLDGRKRILNLEDKTEVWQ